MAVKNTYLIDDDNIFRFATKILLTTEKLSVQVHAFENGKLAYDNLLAKAQNNPELLPELILLDLNMPEMNGWEFLEAIEQAPPIIRETTAIYILTSSIAPKDLDKFTTFPYLKGYINKPLTLSDIKLIRDKFKG